MENKEKFNLVNSLYYVVNSYDNIKHLTIRYRHNDVYYSEDEQLYKYIKESTLKTSKKYFNDEDLFNNNDSLLLYNYFEIEFNKKHNFYIISIYNFN